MLKIKQHIALFFSSLAMLVLLLHGIVPHHHHNAEVEKCNIESQLNVIDHSALNPFNPTCGSTNCCEDHQQDQQEKHACTLNIAASKQVSVDLITIIKSFNFQAKSTQPKLHFVCKTNLFTPSVFSEIRSLRAPPTI